MTIQYLSVDGIESFRPSGDDGEQTVRELFQIIDDTPGRGGTYVYRASRTYCEPCWLGGGWSQCQPAMRQEYLDGKRT